MASKIKIRRDIANNWALNNPVMLDGEQGYEKDTGKLKIGDGQTPWNSLTYQIGTVIPENAKFTDTVYDDSTVLKDTDTVSAVTGNNKIVTENEISSFSSGDMLKSTYDTNDNGVVDNTEKVNNHTVDKDVPSNAVFTDTVYDDTHVLKDSDIGTIVQGYAANTVVDTSYVHTDNNYTTAEKTKLSGIETGATADQTKTDIDTLGIDAATVTGKTIETDVPANADFTNTQVTVEDVLTSTSTINALSANMGKQLQDIKLETTDYATATVGGTIKVRLSGTDLFISSDGTNP